MKFWQIVTLVVLVAVIGVGTAWWQPWRSNTRTIQVSGEGKVKSDPDQAAISGGIDVKNAVAKDAQASATQKLTDITAAVKKLGVTDKEIKTNNISVYPNYNYASGVSNQDGYMAHGDISVTLSDITKGQSVYDAMMAAGATTAYGPNLTFSDAKRETLKKSAQEAAVADAKAKADALAKSMGLKVGKVINVNVSDGSRINPMPYTLSAGSVSTKDLAIGQGGVVTSSAGAISAGESEVDVTVSVTYALK